MKDKEVDIDLKKVLAGFDKLVLKLPGAAFAKYMVATAIDDGWAIIGLMLLLLSVMTGLLGFILIVKAFMLKHFIMTDLFIGLFGTSLIYASVISLYINMRYGIGTILFTKKDVIKNVID